MLQFSICMKRLRCRKDNFKAVDIYKNLKMVSSSCFNLAIMYKNGNGVEKDDFRAVDFYTKACEMNHQKACYNLGVMYLEGDFLAINKTKAKEYFEKSCNLGYSNACKELGKLEIV